MTSRLMRRTEEQANFRLLRIAMICALLSVMGLAFAVQVRAQTTPAPADLPPGFVVINVKGVALRLPAFDPEARDIRIQPAGTLRPQLSLWDVLADQQTAHALFERSQGVLVQMPNIPDRKGQFLGLFERAGLTPYSFSIAIGAVTKRVCAAETETWNQVRDIATREFSEKGTDWVSIQDNRVSSYTRYIKKIPALGIPLNFDSLTCHENGSCAANACIGQVRVGYSFNGAKLSAVDWDRVIKRAAAVWRTILGDEFWSQGIVK